MKIDTHDRLDAALCGKAVFVEAGVSRVELVTTPQMSADEKGLVHGGFLFGAADYAAMIAVNHPYVVLGSAAVKFLKPVRVGEIVVVEARVAETKGSKRQVSTRATREGQEVFEGDFTCFVLDKHVLD
jgi:acyl-coenzyme A thioesterase PaaI-like protein